MLHKEKPAGAGAPPTGSTQNTPPIVPARPGFASHARVYGARTIKRERRTRDRIDALDQQIIGVLEEDHPQSVRHVFYRMTNPRLAEPVEKSDRGYRHVQQRCVELRRNGRIPYGWISDATRRGYFTNTFNGKADFIRRMAGLYRADLWRYAERHVEVWVESRSLAGVIHKDCEDLAVSLYPAGGFSSITLAYEAAININEGTDKPVTIIYIGDYDPAGVLIDVAIERELRKHINPEVELEFLRLGITAEQIEQYDLPTKPRKANDKRALHIEHTVEAEAMPAHVLRSLLRSLIESYLPEDALRVAQVAEKSERDGLLMFASMLGKGNHGI